MAVEVVEYFTDDPEQGFGMLNEIYAPERPMRFPGEYERFHLGVRSIQTGDLGAEWLELNSPLSVSTHPFDTFFTMTVLDGAVRYEAGDEQLAMCAGDVCLYPVTRRLDATWDAVTVSGLRLPMAPVARAARAQAGIEPDELRFHGLAPVSRAAAARWRALNAYVHQVLGEPESFADNPLVRTELIGLIGVTALHVFPNTAMTTGYTPEPGWVGPRSLRRAVAYLHEHIARPVTLTELAEFAGATPRALQAAFRRYHHTTPAGYLRRIRLEGVHGELTEADPAGSVTVAQVAARWGFAPTSRFAEHYRRRFGVLPSQTLGASS